MEGLVYLWLHISTWKIVMIDSDDCDSIFEVHYVGEDVLIFVEVQLKLLKCGYFLNPRLGRFHI